MQALWNFAAQVASLEDARQSREVGPNAYEPTLGRLLAIFAVFLPSVIAADLVHGHPWLQLSKAIYRTVRQTGNEHLALSLPKIMHA